jgi:hypothetical protein
MSKADVSSFFGILFSPIVTGDVGSCVLLKKEIAVGCDIAGEPADEADDGRPCLERRTENG